MKLCTLCRKSLPLSDFNRQSASRDGHQNVCRPCNQERSKKYYVENRETHLVNVKRRNKRIIAENKELLRNYLLAHPCVDCKSEDLRVLEFDHTGDYPKRADVSALLHSGFSWPIVLNEISKCEVRCRNCHAIKTYERAGGSWRSF